MRRIPSRFVCAVHVALALSASSALGSFASAQCLEWQSGFGGLALNGPAYAQVVFDDGTGPALYVGGNFTVAGAVRADHIARWDGSAWSAVGDGFGGLHSLFGPSVYALAVFDDGSGPALYAAGSFQSSGATPLRNLAKWDGVAWTDVGGGLASSSWIGARSLAVYDDGTGLALFVGGSIEEAGTTPVHNVAKWDGAAWSALGVGVHLSDGSSGTVYALEPYDDGTGAKLYATGFFTHSGSTVVNCVAAWDGGTWSPLASGLEVASTSNVASGRALEVFDADGPGGAPARLYVGGGFDLAGGVPVHAIASWNGASFADVAGGATGCPGSTCSSSVTALAALDDGSGRKLFVGGVFSHAGSVPARCVARYDGASWSAVASGLASTTGGVFGVAYSFAGYDDGGGSAVFVVGYFDRTGEGIRRNYIVRYRAGAWSSLVSAGNGVDGHVHSLVRFDDGGGEALYAGGSFTSAGGVLARNVARWNGSAWSPLGAGLNGTVLVLAALPTGLGGCRELYAGGSFTTEPNGVAGGVAKWNGASWVYLTSGPANDGINGAVRAIAAYGGGSTIYVGGAFASAGGLSVSNIARWDGASWSNPGTVNGPVDALASFDDGSGSKLFVGGVFNSVADFVNGPQSIVNIARWNGSTFAPAGTQITQDVHALFAWHDGTSDALYAGGTLTIGAGSPRVMKWTGSAWTGLGTFHGRVRALAAFDDGSGATLYAGGDVDESALLPFSANVVRWNGAAWQDVGGGVLAPSPINGLPRVSALASFQGDPARGPDLYVGGALEVIQATGEISSHIAQWKGCGVPPGTPFCFGDGSLATPCPCAPPDFVPNPPAAPGHGCANSFHFGGALLAASGGTALDDVVLTSRDQTPSGYSFFFVGTADVPSGIAISDGIRCAGGALTRFGAQNAVCGSVRYPHAELGFTVPLSTVSATTPGSGHARFYQVYYRNAEAGFCNPSTANISNGYRITW